MAYLISGVGVEVSQQAVRPREPPRPQPALTTSSIEMATRQARPRSSVVPSNITSKLIAQVTALKGQQAALEKLLKTLGAQLKVCQSVMRNPTVMKMAPAKVAEAKACSVALEKAIMQCIDAIKACAGKANQAAGAAIATGASDAQVRQAAVSVSQSSGQESAIEVSSAGVNAAGQIVPGPGAELVTTPVLTEAVPAGTLPGAEVIPVDSVDAAASAASGIPTWVLVGGAGLAAWLFFRRK